MKILVLTNFYPPYVIGGYEALCQEAVEWLVSRGHIVRILTSRYGVDSQQIQGNIYRVLALEGDYEHFRPHDTLLYKWNNSKNAAWLRRLVSEFGPDVIFIWGMWNLSRTLLAVAESFSNVKCVYYLASPWPDEPSTLASYWNDDARRKVRRVAKKLARIVVRQFYKEAWCPPSPQFAHAICNTLSLRKQLTVSGHALAGAAIVCEGIDLTPYLAIPYRQRKAEQPLKMTFVGRLGWHKGPHTIIEALDELVNRQGRRDIHLTICGGGHQEYKTFLAELVSQFQLDGYVTFRGPFPRPELPNYLAQYDALILSSIWDEALARIMQEAMAAGRVVIGTTTGSTPEFLVNHVSGLTFPPGDALCLASQISYLADNPLIGDQMSRMARQVAIESFDLANMMRSLETLLLSVHYSSIDS